MTSASNSQNYLNFINNVSGSYIEKLAAQQVQPFLAVIPNTNTFNGTPIGDQNVGLALNSTNFNNANTNDVFSFINNVYTKILGYPSTSSIPATAYDATNPQGLLNGFYSIYQYVLGINNPNDTDLNIANATNLPSQFNALFSDFIKQYSFKPSAVGNYDSLAQSFMTYLGTTSVVQNQNQTFFTTPTTPSQFLHPGSTNYIQSFQKIYESFNGPIGTLSTNSASWTVAQQVFVQRFNAFYNAELKKTATSAEPSGFFDTSQDLGDWYNYTQNLYYNPNFNPTTPVQNPHSTIILDTVLRSLINMIGTIQTVAAAQANSLNFLSQWQVSYTNKLNQIHIFSQGDNTVLGQFNITTNGGNTGWDPNAAQAVRNQLNNVNQTYITKLQANQQNISDNAKSLQSNVNQSNDAANQQASLADSVLQELNTILSSIFR